MDGWFSIGIFSAKVAATPVYRAWNSLKFISKSSGMYERKNYFSMNIVEEIFEIRICKEILANDIKNAHKFINTCSTVNNELQGYILGVLHPSVTLHLSPDWRWVSVNSCSSVSVEGIV